jgi:DNA-directed RNA polymerase subunit M/transcription elongation factor TFIIS
MEYRMEYRTKSIDILNKLLPNNKKINIIEQKLFTISNHDEDRYNNILYQIIGDILLDKNIDTIITNIDNNLIEWNHSSFKELADQISEQNEFIQNPFEVEEGVFQCKACGSRRVYSYTKQDRSCDEGTSVYAQCVACKTKWRERG